MLSVTPPCVFTSCIHPYSSGLFHTLMALGPSTSEVILQNKGKTRGLVPAN